MINQADILPLLRQLNKDPAYLSYIHEFVEKEFEQIKKEMIQEFNNHPVTREIDAGTSASNISGTLHGITNLYSFIGFDEGTDPIAPIRKILDSMTMHKSVQNDITIKYTFNIPTSHDIFSVTPMPWAEGRSWAKGIQEGISGIGYYIKLRVRQSRSGLGFQSQEKIRPNIRFVNKPYIADIINRYTKRLKKLESTTIK